MRLDRWFRRRWPAMGLSHLNKICRKGEVRVDGKRVEASDRLKTGNVVRIPPIKLDVEAPAVKRAPEASPQDAKFIRDITLFEDRKLMVLNKPWGLAVQGGSGTTRHIDGMLQGMAEKWANGRCWCIVSTATRQACCSSPRRARWRRTLAKSSVRDRRARSIGPSWKACRNRRRAHFALSAKARRWATTAQSAAGAAGIGDGIVTRNTKRSPFASTQRRCASPTTANRMRNIPSRSTRPSTRLRHALRGCR